jgi:chemotaxis protein MotB
MKTLVATLCGLLFAGCVTTSTHEKALADLKAQDEGALAKVKADGDAKAADLQKQLDAAAQQKAASDAQAKEQEARLADLQAKLDAAQKRLDDLTKSLEGSSGEKARLGKLLADTKGQLDELNRQKAAAEARAATYKKLTSQLRGMIDAGQLSVKIRKGRMLITLPNDVLFDSGSAKLKKAGDEALAKVAKALGAMGDRQFLVAGNTDDRPIHSARFPSNWELSTERAVEVVRTLIAQGMQPAQLGALGYGEFDPIAANDSDENRALNRRIEIQLQPNLSELPLMDDLGK